MKQTKLKEFFYVDVDRTRSLLAQLQGGLVERLTSATDRRPADGKQASHFEAGMEGSYLRAVTRQESRSFQEMTFVAFESLADQQGLIHDLGSESSDVSRWLSGEIHADLNEGQLIRMTCDVQILDGKLFSGRIARFEKMLDGFLAIRPGVTPRNSTPRDRERELASARAEFLGGLQPKQLNALVDFVEAFVGEDISFRALPCGAQHLTLGFGGSLLGRREYIQEERDSLFARYGTVASSWTCVMQIAAIPSTVRSTGQEAVPPPGMVSDAFDRATFEGVAINLLSQMEQAGIVDGPQWPTISVTPLAVYRSVPRGGSRPSSLADQDSQHDTRP